jgi:hypothetical protein
VNRDSGLAVNTCRNFVKWADRRMNNGNVQALRHIADKAICVLV